MLAGWMKGRRYELVVYITLRMMTMPQRFLEDLLLKCLPVSQNVNCLQVTQDTIR